MVLVIIGMTQVLSIRYSAADVGGNAPPPAPTYFLFLYVLLAAPLLLRRSRRLALSRGELLLIYAMMLVAGPITNPDALGFLVPHVVSPYYYNALQPDWALFKPYLPGWLGPSDHQVVTGFFQGTGGRVPWAAWLVPMLAWSSLLIALFFVMLCINVVMRRQWIENERLAFPLAALPLALTEPAGPNASASLLCSLPSLLRAPLFWLGLSLALALQAPGALHNYVPSIPELPLHDVVLLNASTLTPPWNGLGQLSFSAVFWLIGVVYLLPREVAFSAWAFYLLGRIEGVAAVMFGSASEAPSPYDNTFPAIFAQGAGAAFALTAITLFTARRHLRAVLRKVFRPSPLPDDSQEFLSYRTAVFGIIFGCAFILAWCTLAGMRLWVAVLLFGFMLSYFFIFARIRAETGLGMGVIVWPKMLDEVMITVVGAKYLTLADLTILHSLRWLYFGSAAGSVMACQLEGLKLADAGGLRGRRVGWTLALAATLTVIVGFVWTLKTYYGHGFTNLPIGQRMASMVGHQIYWSYSSIVYFASAPKGPEGSGLMAMGTGALVTVALSSLRTRFLWFPFHPIGYLAANAWGMHLHWASFFIGWLIKELVTRYGGMKVYQRLLPLFLGLIVGDMLHAGIWGIVAWATGTMMQAGA